MYRKSPVLPPDRPHPEATEILERGSSFNASELSFELVDDDVVENKIVASRIALTVMEAVSAGFESLRLRVQSLEGQELPKDDLLRPETVAVHLVEQWVKSGMARDDLQTVLDPLQRELAAVLQKVYQACNDFLHSQGVVAQQDLRVRVSRSPTGSGAAPLQSSPASQALAQTQQAMAAARDMAAQASRFGASRMAPAGMHPMHQGMPSMYAGVTPLARARQRAQGVIVQLKRLLTQPATGYDMVNAPPASVALAHALAVLPCLAGLWLAPWLIFQLFWWWHTRNRKAVRSEIADRIPEFDGNHSKRELVKVIGE